ncbi:MAG: hypothetical protein CMC84_02140 [Flavobacteriaceae bacterium]|nr:hypothetical protein [Flavobacteriaceae bacterium]
MNNISKIKNFIINENESKMIINQVSDNIGLFYNNLITNICEVEKIRVVKNSNLEIIESQSLFLDKEIKLLFSNNKNLVTKMLEKNDKIIVLSDYKTFKQFTNRTLSINGYEYQNDMKNYIRNEHKIDDLNLIEFCISNPHLAFSEISKYLINSNGYIKNTEISEKINFILNFRKELFDLKKNNRNIKSIYENLKQEIKYKKFNFLTY